MTRDNPAPAPTASAEGDIVDRLRFRYDAIGHFLSKTGPVLCDAANEIERLRVALASAEPERGAKEREIAAALYLERDPEPDAPWWLPADPGPIECATLADAVREFVALTERASGADGQRIATLTERLARSEAEAERYRFIRERIEDLAKCGNGYSVLDDRGFEYDGATLDDAVDAARRAAAGGEHA